MISRSEDGNDDLMCKADVKTRFMDYVREGEGERIALEHVYYHR